MILNGMFPFFSLQQKVVKILLVEIIVLYDSVGLCLGSHFHMSLLKSYSQHPWRRFQSLHTLPIPAKIYIIPGKTILYSLLDLNSWKRAPQAMALSTLGRFW